MIGPADHLMLRSWVMRCPHDGALLIPHQENAGCAECGTRREKFWVTCPLCGWEDHG